MVNNCLEANNQRVKDFQEEEGGRITPKNSSFRFEDLDTPAPGDSKLLEYSSMSPLRPRPVRGKTKKKSMMKRGESWSSESINLNLQQTLTKQTTHQSEKIKKMNKSTKLRTKKKTKSKKSLGLIL